MSRYDAFLCHASDDKHRVRRLAQKMSDAGLKLWLDEEQIEFGDRITEKIESGLQESNFVLVCLSPKFRESRWCRSEYGPILSREIESDSTRVIPVELAACFASDIPSLLFDKLRVDPWDDVQFDQLLRQIGNRAGRSDGKVRGGDDSLGQDHPIANVLANASSYLEIAIREHTRLLKWLRTLKERDARVIPVFDSDENGWWTKQMPNGESATFNTRDSSRAEYVTRDWLVEHFGRPLSANEIKKSIFVPVVKCTDGDYKPLSFDSLLHFRIPLPKGKYQDLYFRTMQDLAGVCSDYAAYISTLEQYFNDFQRDLMAFR